MVPTVTSVLVGVESDTPCRPRPGDPDPTLSPPVEEGRLEPGAVHVRHGYDSRCGLPTTGPTPHGGPVSRAPAPKPDLGERLGVLEGP